MKKKELFNGLSIGTWLTFAHPAIAEIMADAGFDWIAVDLEHSVINIREAEELIRIIDLKGVTPLVRLTSNDANLIKRVMDSGAHGVIVPMVNTVEDAKKALDAVRYPPIGTRSVGLARAHGYGNKFEEYVEWLKNESTVVFQVEHIDAVRNMREIFSLEGIDGYIVGPYDLSASMGIPGEFENKEFLAAIEEIKTIANEMNLKGGVHIIEPNPEELKMRIDEGFEFIAYSLDHRMLDRACRDGLKILKN